MRYSALNRDQLRLKPLRERYSKLAVAKDLLSVDAVARPFDGDESVIVEETLARIRRARAQAKPVMLAFGAHAIKNGLAPVLIDLIERGIITSLATNGAGIIHDWEFAYLGRTSEDVRANVARGEFGTWQETGYYINLALVVGAYDGLGYGESVGALIENEGLTIPDESELLRALTDVGDLDKAAAAADLLYTMRKFTIPAGWMSVPHPYKTCSVQAAAYRLGVPFTGHPMIGHDIIYTHPLNHGGAVGRTALRDFLVYAAQVQQLDGGVYLSIGSAVMSPMIFEKSLSMAQNIAIGRGEHIDNYYILVADLTKSSWDWQHSGEPPMDNPAYYLRYCKTFSRMGGEMRYLSADNRDLLLTLAREL